MLHNENDFFYKYKILFGISSGGISLGLSCLGLYTYLKMEGYAMDAFSWIPIVSFSFSIFIASWAVLTLPFLVIAELMPEKVISNDYKY